MTRASYPDIQCECCTFALQDAGKYQLESSEPSALTEPSSGIMSDEGKRQRYGLQFLATLEFFILILILILFFLLSPPPSSQFALDPINTFP